MKFNALGEDKDTGDSGISQTDAFLLFSVLGILFISSSAEKLLFFDRSIYILAFLQSVTLNGNIWINSVGVQSQEMHHFETSNLFNNRFWFKKRHCQPPK